MRVVEPPSLDSPGRGHPGDDLDGLLSAFFRSEMPGPWPELELPGEQPPSAGRAARRRPGILRSRFALAASVALLLGSSWLLSSRFPEGAAPGPYRGQRENATNSDRPGKMRIKEGVIVDPSGPAKIRLEVGFPLE